MRKVLYTLLALAFASHSQAANTRHASVKIAFAKVQACPATALNKLPCPGYVIDDKIALDCGGVDEVGNKQWLTVEAAKAKDKWERSYATCKHPTKVAPPQ